MRDLERLAELSHLIDKLTVALCRREADDRSIEVQIVTLADGEREAAAVALSYALRRRELGDTSELTGRVIAALAGVIRRMANPPDQ